MQKKLYVSMVSCLMLLNAGIKMPFWNSAVSGFDRPWMYQMQMRLWGVKWIDFSRPFENALVQIAGHHGQAELLPMFIAVGVNRLLGIPQTAFNIQFAYVLLDTFLLFLVCYLARHLSASMAAGIMAAAMYATYPMLAYVTMYPLQTNFTNLLLSSIVLILILYEKKRTTAQILALAILATFLQLTSRLAVLDALFLFLIYLAFIMNDYLTNHRQSPIMTYLSRQLRATQTLFLAGIGCGVVLNTLIYLVGMRVGPSVFGIYHYFFNHRGVNAQALDLFEDLRFLVTMVGYNGILLMSVGLLISFSFPLVHIKTKTLSFSRALIFIWFTFYFFPPFFARRLDYNEIYFIPMILMTADVFSLLYQKISKEKQLLFASAFTASIFINLVWTVEAVRNIQITKIPFRVASYLAKSPTEWIRWGIHPYYWILGSLNADYHLKATGYWIRKHTSPEESIVLLCGNVWHKMTAEYYFGTPFVNISRPARKRLYYLDRAVLRNIAGTDLEMARRDSRNYIQKHLFRKGYPLDGISDFYVVFIHPLEDLSESGGMAFPGSPGCGPKTQAVLDKKLFAVGEILGARGIVEITIYSFMAHPFVRYEEEHAKRVFDLEFARWEDLWGNNYYAQMDNYFSGE